MLLPAHVTADASNRIPVPKPFTDRIEWIGGPEPIQAWLLLLSPGRFRLLSDRQVKGHPHLEPVRSLITEENFPDLTDPTLAEEPWRAVIVAKLLPASITPPGPVWRISFPRGFEVFVPPDCDRKALSLLFSLEGYLEIWYTDLLKKTVFHPLDGRFEG